MRLELLSPPALVSVADGPVRRPALLLARRADRRYVSVSSGPGLNALRWVAADVVGEPVAAPPVVEEVEPALPWVRRRADR